MLTVSLFACFSQAGAMPVLSSNDPPQCISPVEKAGYWRDGYGYGYWGHGYYLSHGCYRPYHRPSGYGYGPYHRYGYNWRY